MIPQKNNIRRFNSRDPLRKTPNSTAHHLLQPLRPELLPQRLLTPPRCAARLKGLCPLASSDCTSALDWTSGSSGHRWKRHRLFSVIIVYRIGRCRIMCVGLSGISPTLDLQYTTSTQPAPKQREHVPSMPSWWKITDPGPQQCPKNTHLPKTCSCTDVPITERIQVENIC